MRLVKEAIPSSNSVAGFLAPLHTAQYILLECAKLTICRVFSGLGRKCACSGEPVGVQAKLDIAGKCRLTWEVRIDQFEASIPCRPLHTPCGKGLMQAEVVVQNGDVPCRAGRGPPRQHLPVDIVFGLPEPYLATIGRSLSKPHLHDGYLHSRSEPLHAYT